MGAKGVKAPPLFLASQSPRRKDLLEQLGLRFQVFVPKTQELRAPSRRGKNSPSKIVEKIAAAKAHAAVNELLAIDIRDALVIAADTLVFQGQTVLGKPKDEVDARKMLKKLSGKAHTVATAVHVTHIHAGKIKKQAHGVTHTKVHFFPLSRIDLDWYIATGEPFDKAGAYGAQSYGTIFLKKLDGSYTNVVGLPLGETMKLLTRASGLPWQAFREAKT